MAAITLLLFLIIGVTLAQESFPVLFGCYLGQQLPKTRPALFAPGVVSTDLHDDFSPAFTPDGREVFFRCVGNGQMIILHMTTDSAGQWSQPTIAPFSGRFRDLGAFISRDGTHLFFSSDRPSSESDTTGDLDLFVVDRSDSGWGDLRPLSIPAERSGDVLGCSVDSGGMLYYYARPAESHSGYDIFRTRLVAGVCTSPERLPPPINTPGDETCPCVARDGSFLIYTGDADAATGRAGLRVAFVRPDDSWSGPINLTEHLGLKLPGKFAGLSPDGRYLFFVVPESEEANRRLGRRWEIDALKGAQPRHGGGNVYWVSASVIEDMRPDK